MSVKKDLKRLAGADSRRFAKGTSCVPITDQKTLAIMRKYRLMPPGIILNGQDSNGNKWIDTAVGKFFVIPVGSLEEYIQVRDETSYVVDIDSIRGKTSEELNSAQLQEEAFVNLLKQIVGTVTLTKSQIVSGLKDIDPIVYNVIIETIDLNQSLTCTFLEKAQEFNRPKDQI